MYYLNSYEARFPVGERPFKLAPKLAPDFDQVNTWQSRCHKHAVLEKCSQAVDFMKLFWPKGMHGSNLRRYKS
jgi:hypothetical protein